MENMGCYLPNSIGGGYGGGDILWKTSPSSTSTSSGGNLKSAGSQEYLSGGGGCRSPSSSLTEFNMCSFPLSPFDLEPLPNIFSFAPCSSTYKDFPSVYKEKNPQDMADVLLSLKHAVVHPSQMASSGGGGSLPSLSPAGNFAPYVVQQPGGGGTSSGGGGVGSGASTHLSPASVSFSVQPQAHQVMSPSHHGYSAATQYPHQYPIGDSSGITSTTSGCNVPSSMVNSSGGMHPYQHHHHATSHQNLTGHGGSQGPNIFPSMSVNVSMNMTMGVPGVPNPYNIMEQMCSPHHHHHHHHHQQWAGSSAVSASAGPGPQSYGGPNASGMASAASLIPQSQTNLMGPLQMSYATNPAQHSGYVSTPSSYSFTAEFRPSPACSSDVPMSSTTNFIDKDFGPLKNVNMNVVTPFKTMKSSAASSSGANSTSFVGFGQVNKRRSSVPSSSSSSRLPCNLVNGMATSNSTSEGASLSATVIPGGYMSDIISKVNLCRICGKTYARPSTLKTHMRTHSGEKPYRCSTCHKSFSQAANLTAHIRTHSGEKPFQCTICDRRFSQSSSVTTHMRTHSGERPYRCRACKKAFSDSSTLTKHLRIHSGEKPYQCKLCLLRFSQSGNLNRHMRVHSNPI